MVNLNRNDLLYALIDSFRMYTEAVLFAGGTNPYEFSLNGEPTIVFIGNVHFAGRSDSDEYRIQCPGDLPGTLSEYVAEGRNVLILGYFSDLELFSAWDPERFVNRNTKIQRFSMYTRLSKLREARQRGFSTYVDSDQQNIVLFRPEFIGLYVENAPVLHEARAQDLQKLVSFYEPSEPGKQPRRRVTINKRRIEVTHTQYARSPQFRAVVLAAYRHRCAICGLQLELVEAAHIVPHAHPKGLDVVENGVALCALHHKSFDIGLLYFDDSYSIMLNPGRLAYLRKIGKNNGLNLYTRALRSQLVLPSKKTEYPAPENILLGNQIRGVEASAA
jgi:putative restriction endonuclease